MSNNCEIKQKPKTVKELMKSWYFWKPALGLIIGGGVGFLYYYFIGCSSGSCAITSSPINSTIGGSLLGFFIVKRPCQSCS